MRKHFRLRAMAAAGFSTALFIGSATPVGAVDVSESDDQVTGQPIEWVRHDGGTDDAIELCNDDSATGGSRRQANEPYSVVDPTDPDTIVTGWNDYCLADLNMGGQGFGYSRDGGQTWFNSLVPGYPLDTSEEGQESPLFGNQTFMGDPIAAFDNTGNLFVGGIAFNRADAINGSVYVATYTADDVPITGADAYPVNYSHTRIVGVGTPSRNFFGIFQDKPMLEVDRTQSAHSGNVYVCWARFTGFGQNKLFFSRSTDHGQTFSQPIAITNYGHTGSVQFCDITVEADGDVYVTFRSFNDPSAVTASSIFFVRSTNGGRTFSTPKKVRDFVPYFPFDGARDCGDGPFTCPTEFVFHRVPDTLRVTSDPTGALPGIFIVHNEVDRDTIVPSTSSYQSAGGGRVGQSRVYVIRSTNNGATWTAPAYVDEQALGHQWWPDIDAFDGKLAVVWQDSRTDLCYSVQRPFGNTPDATSCGTNISHTFIAGSDDGGASWTIQQASEVAHQPQYEMFGNRDIPFQGDYNWISLAPNGNGGVVGYATWTDNRDVEPGDDPREASQDGFDVHQCRTQTDGVWGPDTCPNAGGLDQNIYGIAFTFAEE